MHKNIILTIAFGFCVCMSSAQLLFVEERGFLNLETNIKNLPEGTVIDSSQILNGDTLAYIVTSSDGDTLINGQYHINERKNLAKIGVWHFYYPNGNIQSIREYKSDGTLVNIEALLNTNGDSLSIGFPYKNSNNEYYGHMYQYDQNGELNKVVRYLQGIIVESFAIDKFAIERLKIPALRKYHISDTDVLIEYQFDEAVELLKTDAKPLLIRAGYRYSGLSRLMEENIFSDPDIAKLLKDNFHFVYLDLNQQTSISFEHNGQVLTFEPDSAKRGSIHKIVTEFFGVQIKDKPAFILLDTDLSLIGTSYGLYETKEEFIHHLKYYLDGHFHGMKYSDYNPGVNNKFKAIFR